KTLWVQKPLSFEAYLDGLKHVKYFMLIGLNFALSILNKNEQNLTPAVDKYAECYGFAIQILDDLREIEEDRTNGYHSYPMIEGFPHAQSLARLRQFCDDAKKAIPFN